MLQGSYRLHYRVVLKSVSMRLLKYIEVIPNLDRWPMQRPKYPGGLKAAYRDCQSFEGNMKVI